MIEDMFDDGYFVDRDLSDGRRIASFLSEEIFMRDHFELRGTVLDVGCSTGEFLQTIKWEGRKFGTEINAVAAAKASTRGIRIVSDIESMREKLSLIVVRGVIQHLKDPFSFLETAFDKLEIGGHLVFLATPNAESLVYRIFGTLPALDLERNFWVPRHLELVKYCQRVGFRHVATRFPYRDSPYARRTDFLRFSRALLSPQRDLGFAFPKNMMDAIFEKPGQID